MNRREFLECIGAASTIALFPQLAKPIKEEELAQFKRGPIIFRAPLLTCDKPNKNGHIYPRKVVEQMLVDCEGQEIPGIIGFDGFTVAVQFSQMSHLVTDLSVDGDVLTGRIRVLDTPQGKVLTKLINEMDVVFRTGGVGSVSDCWTCDGKYMGGIIQRGFKLAAVAAVPADKGA